MARSSRPYLLQGLYQWLVDNDLTPHLVVDVNCPGVDAPVHLSQEGQLVLNISPGATSGLLMDEQGLSFSARFGGVSRQIFIPSEAVLAIYARENSAGMALTQVPELKPMMGSESEAEQEETPTSQDNTTAGSGPASHLKVIK